MFAEAVTELAARFSNVEFAAETFHVVQSKWSFTVHEPFGPLICVLDLMNGQVL